jgi:hypothetical protein
LLLPKARAATAEVLNTSHNAMAIDAVWVSQRRS